MAPLMRAASAAGICEDDDALRGALRSALERGGLPVRATASGAEAVRAFSEQPPDVLVLDIGPPDADGRDVCQALRARGVVTPVLFLTARDAVPDRVSGFHAGGDDYLTKPFALSELLVRVQALLKRAAAAPPSSAETAPPTDVRLDATGHSVRCGERSEPLTPTEFRLLAALAAKPGAVIRRRQLVAAAWPDGAIVHDNTLDAYIGRLRRKLRDLESKTEITTARGVGYKLR